MTRPELPHAGDTPAHSSSHPASAPDASAGAPPSPSGDATGASASDTAPTASAATPTADTGSDASGSGATTGTISTDQVKLALRRVKDPELNLNILDLGLIYDIKVEGNDVAIDMSLTSPGCPSGPEIMKDAEDQLKAMPGVGAVAMNLVWSPPWTPDRIEPRVRAYLGF